MLPRFYIPVYDPAKAEFALDEDNSRHIIQVFRMNVGDPIQLTDGRGHLMDASILDDHKKKCRVRVLRTVEEAASVREVTLAVSLLKNANRFEWLLEKATEIGVTRILPLLCDRTEKHQLRMDRMQQILISAMLQSQQTRLPELAVPTAFEVVVEMAGGDVRKLIAHCGEGKRVSLVEAMGRRVGVIHEGDKVAGGAAIGPGEWMILIGPEGDFSPGEIGLALERGFEPVTLGATRLRTETAGIVAATLLCVG